MQIGKMVIVNALKMALVAGLLYWMVASGRLSWEQMSVVLRRPDAILAAVGVWLIGPVTLGTWRWWLLMRGVGLRCDFWRAMRLQLVGFFFNTAMPGAVGGDVVKAIYIMKDQPGGKTKTPAMLSVLLDRIVGLIGLFTMGIVAAGLSYAQLSQNPVTAQLMVGLAVVAALSALFLGVVFIPYRDGRDPVARLLSAKVPGFSILHGIYMALRSYRDHPGIIMSTIGISVVVQIIFMLFMGFIGRIIYGPEAFDATLLAPIFPFGILVTAIPLAPGGLGVGHAAFDHLFSMVGLPGGANVFNAYIISQLLLNLLGVVPYLLMKSNLPQALDHKVQVV